MKRRWPYLLLAILLLFVFLHSDPVIQPPAKPVPPVATSAPEPEPAVPLQDDVPFFAEVPPPPVEEAAPVMMSHPMLTTAWLLKHQNEDGSWGDVAVDLDGLVFGRTGVTSFAVLAFLSLGYTHLSRDVIDGVEVGKSMKAALKWLLAREERDTQADEALASLALCETYGMTGSEMFKNAALDSIFGVLNDNDPRLGKRDLDAWRGLAFGAARLDGLVDDQPGIFPEYVQKHFKEQLDGSPDLGIAAAATAVDPKLKAHPALADLQGRVLVTPLAPGAPDLLTWYRSAMVVGSLDDKDPRREPWMSELRQALKLSMRPEGCWSGSSLSERTLRTGLGQMCWSILYRYRSCH